MGFGCWFVACCRYLLAVDLNHIVGANPIVGVISNDIVIPAVDMIRAIVVILAVGVSY